MENKKGLNIWIKIIIGLVILTIITVVSVLIWYNSNISAKSKEYQKIGITIEMGSGTSSIAKTLADAGIIKNEFAFRIYVKLNKISGFQAGNYSLSPNMDVATIAASLKDGKVYEEQVIITFIEGKNMMWIANEIAKNTDNTEQDVYDLLKDNAYIDGLINKYWFLEKIVTDKNIYYPLEGYLYPDTYYFAKNDSGAKTIFATMLDKMDKVLTKYKDEIEKSKYSVHELLTMASIVELEGLSSNDRKDTASVFYNRLTSGMSLGSDVTTYYAFKINMGDRDLTVSELNSSNPYNTRGPNMGGKLPIGPICSPSEASIEAAITPNKTSYLYFVADKNGDVYFTQTYSAHVQKVQELKNKGLWFEY